MSGLRSVIFKNKYLILILFFAAVLRFWKIDRVPVSLFSDELDVGYQAYSIIKTGKDYFGNLIPLHFQSYADFRTPFYIYSSVPTVAVFGISPFGVRLPAVIFGVFGVWGIYLLAKEIFKDKKLGILASLFLAISPWHLQYSRAGFEATMLLAFLLFGLYFFFRSLRNGKFLWISVLLLIFTPLIYSTAKLFTPLLTITLIFLFKKELSKMAKKYIIYAALVGVIFGLPTLFGTLFQGVGERFSYISIFTDPTTKGEVETLRLDDAKMREKYSGDVFQKGTSRLIHNKPVIWTERIINNYLKTFSTEFLFNEGDPNLRHSIKGIGQFYKAEVFALIIGWILFFTSKLDRKIKLLIAFWILVGILPSSITRDGGNHATRLILILPPLVFLISFGIIKLYEFFGSRSGFVFLSIYFLLLTANFIFYWHSYWIHNPWYSERSWHAGYKEVIEAVKENENKYGKIILSNANDDSRIFLAAYYPYEPEIWQKEMEQENVAGFGNLQNIDKFYFGQVDGEIGIDNVSEFLGKSTLYIAASREVEGNLIMEPNKIPKGLALVRTVSYPSEEPAFYLFERSEK